MISNLLPAVAVLLAAQAEPVRQAPRRIPAGEHGVGRRVADLELRGLDGATRRLSEIAPRRPLVLALASSSCPISRKYAPSLARLEDACRARGVAFAYLAPIAADSAADLAALAKEQGFDGPLARGPEAARALGALTTTDCFLLDASRTLVYRGAVDDQYGLGYSLDAPRATYLGDAVDALLSGRDPAVAATWAPGCALDPGPREAPSAPPTWHGRISRIVQRACLDCHRKGGLGPFPLETASDLAAHRGMIRKVVESGAMPPWFAAPPREGEPSPWANDRALAAQEKADLLAWLAGGLPEGDPAEAPSAKSFPSDWRIGKPDVVFELPREVEVKAEGTMGYVNLEVPTRFAEDRWVKAIEIRPTAPEVVHHVLVWAKEPARKGRLEDPLAYFAVYVPGQSTAEYPDGFGRPLPAGSKLKFQMHYTPNGKAAADRTKIGLVFAKDVPRYRVRTASIANPFLRIPAEAADHAEKARIPVPLEVEVLSYFPHMHLRGKSIRYELLTRDGKREPLLEIPRYDFNWQLSYRYAERRRLPAGSTIEVTGRFDNSRNNPANPDSSKEVRWGEQTHEEMLIGFVEFVVPAENPAAGR